MLRKLKLKAFKSLVTSHNGSHSLKATRPKVAPRSASYGVARRGGVLQHIDADADAFYHCWA